MQDSDDDLDDDIDDDFWQTFERGWEQEFQKFQDFSVQEDEHLTSLHAKVEEMVDKVGSYSASIESKVRAGDEMAHRVAAKQKSILELEKVHELTNLKDNAKMAQRQILVDGLRSSDDLVKDITEDAADRRAAREARRREEKKARDAEIAARSAARRQSDKPNDTSYKTNFDGPSSSKSPPPSSSAGGATGSSGARRNSSPPRYTRKPGAHANNPEAQADAKAAAQAKAAPPLQFSSFAEFDKAWVQFEQQVSKAGQGQLRHRDVPWPTSLISVSGISVGDDPKSRKVKLRNAVLRWHPDKWAPIVECIVEADRPKVMEDAKAVTRRILEERTRYNRK